MKMKKRTRQNRLPPAIRKQKILESAIDLAIEIGYRNLTQGNIATAADVAVGLIPRYFTNMAVLRTLLIKTAIKREILPIIAEGLMLKNRYILNIPIELKEKALKNLIR